ncbi:MAG TPA: biotin-dependent carboxyltransferase family protein [Stellaceae bacterium]|nr:biotin-dependent carboxyltransferase family protein [Stellaceae bacterium]
MTLGFKVLSPGLHTTVQDLGRVGQQRVGVPVSGALDGESLALANALVGNRPGMPALEILHQGPRFAVSAERVRIALAGDGAAIELASGEIVPAWRSASLERGSEFSILAARGSVCAYLAVAGGIDAPLFLGSASTYVRGRFGGIEGRALRAGDIVPLTLDRTPEGPELRLPKPPSAGLGERVRVVLGPQREFFTEDAIAALLDGEFRVSQNADRMGMRLDGPRLAQKSGWDIISDAIPTGAIQVPGSGQPILLLADHQTTGGYPKIACVVSADLARVGRCRPGDVLRFAAVEVEEAEALAREAAARLADLAASLEPCFDAAALDLGSLYRANLISGVVSARE